MKKILNKFGQNIEQSNEQLYSSFKESNKDKNEENIKSDGSEYNIIIKMNIEDKSNTKNDSEEKKIFLDGIKSNSINIINLINQDQLKYEINNKEGKI